MKIYTLKSGFIILIFWCSISPLFSQKITKVTFKENKKTKISFLQKITEVKVGQALDSTRLEKDIRFLKRLPLTSHAYYQVTKKENGYHVEYGVQENFTLIPNLNFYNTTDGELAIRVGAYEYNFLGRNISIGGLYQNDIYNSYGFNFRAPQLFNKKWGAALNYSNLTTREPVFLNSGTADYKYNNTSYEALSLFQYNLKHRFESGATFFTENYDYLEGATSPDVPQNFIIDKFLFKFIYEFNNLNYYYQNISGIKNNFRVQYVVSTEQVLPDFLFFQNDFFYFKRITSKGTWASRLRLGLATNDKSPFAPFAVDNNLNIRGVGNLIDRGTGVIVFNTEYRETLVEKNWFILQSNLFVDSGSWRNPGGDFSDFAKSYNIRIFPGVGLRFIHKKIFNAVLRVDYGYGIMKNDTSGIVFGIGQYF